MTDKIRFAQLSFWFSHGHSLASAAQSHAQAELACVWDEDTERGAAAAQKYGVPFIADLDELREKKLRLVDTGGVDDMTTVPNLDERVKS